jgi:hypothetical protein
MNCFPLDPLHRKTLLRLDPWAELDVLPVMSV